ncbi:hypothetical protein QI724_004677 [Vibrio parahaemolyticus]|uniref:hypothetical protein n=1 Tax=Vibrio parahaemolyticus TaxID=670 RepID=UPI00280D4C0B|nr:hypothetical protein [Vibrio parahaemolyticus]
MNTIKNIKQSISMKRHFASTFRSFKKRSDKSTDSPKDFYRTYEKCTVLGNGPSLKSDINNISKDTDVIAVNHFSESEHFTTLKPNKYILIDSYFWDEATHSSLVEKRDKLFKDLNELVSWKMQLIIPDFADIAFIQGNIKNSNIAVKVLRAIPSNVTNIKYGPIALSSGIVAPPAVNVLIFAVYVAILCEYDSVEIFGADMSFHNDVHVDQDNNQLYMVYKHFYGKEEKLPLLENPQKIKPFNMTDLMRLTFLTFYAHQLLNKWAELKEVKVVNRSNFSMIDAYPRQ